MIYVGRWGNVPGAEGDLPIRSEFGGKINLNRIGSSIDKIGSECVVGLYL